MEICKNVGYVVSSTAWSELLASAMEIIMSKLLFFGAMTGLNEQRNVINNLEGIGSWLPSANSIPCYAVPATIYDT